MARIFVCTDNRLAGLLEPAVDRLRSAGHEVVRGPGSDAAGATRNYSVEERREFIDDADVAVFTPRHACSGETMAGARRLRGVCSPVIGIESIDLAAANELGIVIGHGAVRGNVVGVAESTVMLMLMLFYDVETNIRRIHAGQWRRPGHHSRQFEGKTIGLIGFGRIARVVAARLSSFGVRIVTHSPRLKAEDIPSGVEKVDLETLLRVSDVVSLHTGLTPETRHMINAERLALMKPTAYLVNTDRGGVVDEAALVAALHEKRIAGAALDTFSVEPVTADNPLLAFENVIATPHCVGHTVEGWEEFVPALVENIEDILAGRLPVHCKNPAVEPAWRERLRRLGH